MDWYLKVLKNYVGFRGRARRKEYWMFILVNIIFTFVLGLLDKMLGDAPRDKCAHFREINGIAAAFQYLQKNYNPTASPFL